MTGISGFSILVYCRITSLKRAFFEIFEGCLTLLRPLELCVLPEKFVEAFGNVGKWWNGLPIITCQTQEMSKFFHNAGLFVCCMADTFQGNGCIPCPEIRFPK